MKIITKIVLAVLLPITTFSQFDEVNYWYFGSDAGIEFNNNSPSAIAGTMYSPEGCASISDGCGLLFYTDGDTIFDRTHTAMENGQGLSGRCLGFWYQSGTQPALIVRKPASDSIFYVFTNDCIEDTLLDGFRYSIVDMSLNGGLGDVALKDQFLFASSTEKVAAHKHADGSSIWVVAHEYKTNCFYSYLLTDTGLVEPPVISCTGQVHEYTPIGTWTLPEQISRGWMKFSHNGNKLVLVATPDDILPIYGLYPELFDFDNTTGLVTSDFILEDPDTIRYYGAAFSPDDTKLYLSGAWYGDYIHQFDLTAGTPEDILGSRYVVNNDTDFTYFASGIQNGPDGKIYTNYMNASEVGSINSPNMAGVGCDYTEASFPLYEGTYSHHGGITNFAQNYFNEITLTSDFSSSGTLLGIPVSFVDNSIEAVSWKWEFGDGNISYSQSPTHIYSNPGTYTVSLAVMDSLNNYRKSCQTITIHSISSIESHKPNEWKVYPNPFNDHTTLTFENENNKKFDLTLYNLTGQIVKSINGITEESVLFKREDISSGLYIFRLSNDQSVVAVGKLVVE